VEAKTRKALFMWRNKSMVVSLRVWYEHAAEETRKRNVMKRVVMTVMRRRLSEAMRRWCENLKEQRALVAKHRLIGAVFATASIGKGSVRKKMFLEAWRLWSCKERQFGVASGRLSRRIKQIISRRIGLQVLYSWNLWLHFVSISARLTALSSNLLLQNAFSKWCMLCQDLCMDNKTTSGTANNFRNTFGHIFKTTVLEDMFPIIMGELEGSREKIEFMTREDEEPKIVLKTKGPRAVRSAANLQRSSGPVQGQEHQNEDSSTPLSSPGRTEHTAQVKSGAAQVPALSFAFKTAEVDFNVTELVVLPTPGREWVRPQSMEED
jgi:hypothetical protein